MNRAGAVPENRWEVVAWKMHAEELLRSFVCGAKEFNENNIIISQGKVRGRVTIKPVEGVRY
jgi:hypothetical protein